MAYGRLDGALDDILVIHSLSVTPPPDFQASVRAVASPSVAISSSVELRPASPALIEVRKVTARTSLLGIPPGYAYRAPSTIITDEHSVMANL